MTIEIALRETLRSMGMSRLAFQRKVKENSEKHLATIVHDHMTVDMLIAICENIPMPPTEFLRIAGMWNGPAGSDTDAMRLIQNLIRRVDALPKGYQPLCMAQLIAVVQSWRDASDGLVYLDTKTPWVDPAHRPKGKQGMALPGSSGSLVPVLPDRRSRSRSTK